MKPHANTVEGIDHCAVLTHTSPWNACIVYQMVFAWSGGPDHMDEVRVWGWEEHTNINGWNRFNLIFRRDGLQSRGSTTWHLTPTSPIRISKPTARSLWNLVLEKGWCSFGMEGGTDPQRNPWLRSFLEGLIYNDD